MNKNFSAQLVEEIMTSDLNDHIIIFNNYFKEKIQETNKNFIQGTHTKTFQEILYISILDGLSKSVYPEDTVNSSRMESLISNFSDWKEYDRVSLPHLAELLKYTSDPAFKPLDQYVKAEINKWEDGARITLDRDPTFIDIYNQWPSNSEGKCPIEVMNNKTKKGKKIYPKHVKQFNLFYNNRNRLIHEGLDSGRSAVIQHWPINEPHYMQNMKSDINGNNIETWDLYYPLAFYTRISETCLNNIIMHLTLEHKDPLSSYSLGDFWIEELNP